MWDAEEQRRLGGDRVYENPYVLSAQFCYKPKAAIKKKVYEKIHMQKIICKVMITLQILNFLSVTLEHRKY